MSGLDVVTLGEAMALFLAEPGTPLASATRFRRSVAGAESNVAVGLARLGHRAGWVGRVGADALGEAVLRCLRAEGVDVSRARVDPDATTGVLVRDCHGDRAIEVLYHRGDGRLAPEDVDEAYVASARVLHVTGITPLLGDGPRAAVAKAVGVARRAGVAVSLDPNVRRKLAPEAVIRDRLADGRETWTQPAPAIRPVDPVGAGDAFDAGFLSAWLGELSVPDGLRQATAVAALCVQSPTDLDGLPTVAERDREPEVYR